MVKNNYIDDAKYFLKQSSNQIKRNIEQDNLVQIVLNFALGIERILKGILYDVNPLYVLITPEFKNSFPLMYSDRKIYDSTDEQVIKLKPDGDVLTFKNSLIRAQLISKVVFENKSTLYILMNFRDIIAHCNLNTIDYEKMEILIYRDYYPLIRSFCDELQIPKTHFFDNSSIRIAKISSDYQVKLKDQIKLKLEASTEYWESIKDDEELIAIADEITTKQLKLEGSMEVKCPCCGNMSILYHELIYEHIPQINETVLTDYIPRQFSCKYCKLTLDEYSQIDNLIMPLISHNYQRS